MDQLDTNLLERHNVNPQRRYIDDILDRELELTLKGVELGSSRDDSMRELTNTAATLYDRRILRELIQNAYDGSGAHESAEILLRLDLRAGANGVLDIANSGQGFTGDDVDSIVNPALSRKRPGNAIGHKGLGFRSVGLVTDDPQIFSVASSGEKAKDRFDGFCFRFASPDDQRRRLRAISGSPKIEEAVGKTHQLQLPIPIDDQSDDVRQYARAGFATLVRLPLRDSLAARQMSEEWQALFDQRAPLALFLTRIALLTIERFMPDGSTECRALRRHPRPLRGIPSTPELNLGEVELDGRRFLIASQAVDRRRFFEAVERAIAEQHRVEKWRDWQGDPIVSVAVPLAGEAQAGCYYAFLPMETPSPFNGFLDAPFFPDPDRKDLALSNPLNDMFLDVVAEICLKLVRTFADANETRADLVHAAVDAIAWSTNGERIFTAIGAADMTPADLPLPVVRLASTGDRWSTLDQVFDWRDEDFQLLKGAWIARVNNVALLRRNMGGRRVDGLRKLAEEAELPLEPPASKLAEWIPPLAADLARQRKTTRQGWEAFYADVAGQREVLPLLRGSVIFRNDEGKLVAANGATTNGAASQFFINPHPEQTKRKRNGTCQRL
jgi:hypothetical protein